MQKLGYTTYNGIIMSFSTDYNEAYKNEIKKAGARWNAEKRIWNLKIQTIKNIEDAERICCKYNITYDIGLLKQLYAKLKEDKAKKEALIEMSKKADIKGCSGIKTPDGITLYPYQQVAVKWIESVNHALIADDCGLGKSAEALTFCYNNPNKFPVLIIVPACVKTNWAREIKKFCNSESVCNQYVLYLGVKITNYLM